jgi:DNA uptake protein ComE-like DNA-binding protein
LWKATVDRGKVQAATARRSSKNRKETELRFERNIWDATAGLVVASALALAAWPAVSQAQPPATSQAETPPAAAKKPAAPKKVDLNNASLAELKTLPTVGDAEAKKIIAHRPYKSKGELVTKAGLPEGVYHAVKRMVELQTPRKAAPKK